jgi:predicted N-acetyltransferase YhbS
MTSQPVMRALTADDQVQVSDLHARVFGPGRFARSAYRVREGGRGTPRLLSPYCRCVVQGTRVIGALTLTEIAIGGTDGALLLGPVAVDPAFAGQGYGRGMIASALEGARGGGVRLVVLVGDAPYYAPLGFRVVPAGQIVLPGPVNPARLLAAELAPDALEGYSGLVVAR